MFDAGEEAPGPYSKAHNYLYILQLAEFPNLASDSASLSNQSHHPNL